MTCPRCGSTDVLDGSCLQCGIVVGKYRVGKYRAHAERPPAAGPPLPAPTSSASPGFSVLMRRVLLACLAVASAFLSVQLLMQGPVSVSPTPQQPLEQPPVVTDVPRGQPLELLPSPETPDSPTPRASPAAQGAQDSSETASLFLRLSRGALTEADLQRVQTLYDREPAEPRLRLLLGQTLLFLGERRLGQGSYATAENYLERSALLLPREPRPWLRLSEVGAHTLNWHLAESAAREALERDAAHIEALRGLAMALFRQDRNREARQVLEALLDLGEDPGGRALLARIDKASTDERSMLEKRAAHFHVRYDGDVHEGVGQEIVRALEQHYASLRPTFGHSLSVAVPVILFTRDDYYKTSGVPRWAGGHYNQLDGRIRIPVGGLTTSLPRGLDSTLVHEVTHAFVHDLSRGTAPRPINEGLAQYMEGKRIDESLSPEQRTALADGRLGGVRGFYWSGLALVEHLYGQRGQGGVNDLLRRMGETRQPDEACRDVFGYDFATLQRNARYQLRRRWGS